MKLLPLTITLLVAIATTATADLPSGWAQANKDSLEKLFKSLDTDIPALAVIARHWHSGDSEDAAVELAGYFRNQSFDLSVLEPPFLPPDPQEWADAAMQNRFQIHGRWIHVPAVSGNGLDWDYRGDSGDKEIAWMLNRHTFLPVIAEACRRSDEEEYKILLNRLIRNWISANRYPDRITFSSQWRPLEAARRVINSWIHVFYGYTDLLDDSTVLLMLASLCDHADALDEHASFWGGNHLLTEKSALLAIGSAWPQFSEADTWKSKAISRVTGHLLKQSYPDGSYTELSNHYQRVVLSSTLPFLKLMREDSPGYRDTEIYRRIEKMWEFFTHSMGPDGTGPLNNASDLEVNRHFINDAWEFFGQPQWQYVATGGEQGTRPAGSPSRLFPWAGQVFMRNAWNNDADWVYFDAGPYGTGHQHVDRLHLSVSLKGRKLLSDSGRYTYKPGVWKDYFTGPHSHSIILLDGHAARQGPWKVKQPMDIQFKKSPFSVYASATAYFHPRHDVFRSPVPWTRHVIYDRRGFVIVLDSVMALKPYRMQILWQFAQGISAEEAAQIVQPDFSVTLTSTVLAEDEGQPGGYISTDYSVKQPAVQLVHEYGIKFPATVINIVQSPEDPPLQGKILRDDGSGSIGFSVTSNGIVIAEGTIETYPEPRLVRYVASGP